MKRLEVKQELFADSRPEMDEISRRLDSHGPGHLIGNINWKEYSYKPGVRFNIAYGEKEIFLKYYVKEECYKAEKTETNQMVCEDSCVEFFVSPADDGIYYNIEFNAIGTCLMGSGTGRNDSTRAPAEIIEKIRRLSSRPLIPEKEIRGTIDWTITLAIPAEVFYRHDIRSFKGRAFRANFYKCGDMLSSPHYITWNPVDTPLPDYHRPEYFGVLKFI